VVIVSHPARAVGKDFVEVADCASQRANRPPLAHEVLLDEADGLDWPTLCKCDCVFAVPREELKERRGEVFHGAPPTDRSSHYPIAWLERYLVC
jgi:hypothetical protein